MISALLNNDIPDRKWKRNSGTRGTSEDQKGKRPQIANELGAIEVGASVGQGEARSAIQVVLEELESTNVSFF